MRLNVWEGQWKDAICWSRSISAIHCHSSNIMCAKLMGIYVHISSCLDSYISLSCLSSLQSWVTVSIHQSCFEALAWLSSSALWLLFNEAGSDRTPLHTLPVLKSILIPSAVPSGSGVCFVDFSGRYSNIFGNRNIGKAAKGTLNESLHRS